MKLNTSSVCGAHKLFNCFRAMIKGFAARKEGISRNFTSTAGVVSSNGGGTQKGNFGIKALNRQMIKHHSS